MSRRPSSFSPCWGSTKTSLWLSRVHSSRPTWGVDSIEAEHVTLVLAKVSPGTEVQLLKYRHPDPLPNPAIWNLTKLGFNHVRFAVDDLDAEVARLKAKGVPTPERDMEFHNRKLLSLGGPMVPAPTWEGKSKARFSCLMDSALGRFEQRAFARV